MRAYEAALEEPQAPLGAEKRSLPGSVSAVIAAYYDSEQFFGSKAVGTKAMRRAHPRTLAGAGRRPADREDAAVVHQKGD